MAKAEEPVHRILVVDDNRTNRLKLSMSLEQQGHTVCPAEGGQQALDRLKAEAFDVILLDILMPGMDGYQVLERIKSDPERRDIPVIVISAVDDIDSVVRCIEMGADDYLPKAFNPVLLRARLNASLQRKKLRDLEKVYLQQEVMLRQNEKLATLGKLSAGMAHELNNPAAAALRGAKQLQTAFGRLQQAQLKLSEVALTAAQRAALLAFDELARERARKPVYLDALARSDREAEMEKRLQALGVENAWEVGPTLVTLGTDTGELARLVEAFTPAQLSAGIEWLNYTADIYSLLEEIGQGTGRIAELVKALKAYTYMDQAPVQSVDIHDGLENTLIILRTKLAPGVAVEREYAANLPRIDAYGSELNQVWTNLIDNAIDAMDGQGKITLRTRAADDHLVVEVEDTGPGIPEAVRAHIFDPFFTTKPPGHGTGLGLSISHNIVVQKHHGRIDVTSEPGRTRFSVQLPLHLAPGG
jgi:signal transduction histidine kinase